MTDRQAGANVGNYDGSGGGDNEKHDVMKSALSGTK
jgi:hypothetical protein